MTIQFTIQFLGTQPHRKMRPYCITIKKRLSLKATDLRFRIILP